MQQRHRYAFALLAGTVAGAASYAGVAPVFGTVWTWVAVGVNAVIWVLGICLCAFVLAQLDARVDAPESDQLRRGGIAGTISVSFLVAAGVAVVVAAFTTIGVGAVAGLFMLGIGVASAAVGLLGVGLLFSRRSQTAPAENGSE